MAFFKDLKASVKQIGEELDKITLAYKEIPVGTEFDHARALAYEDVVKKKHRILDLKVSFEKLLTELTPQFNRNSSCLNSMSELMAEIEDKADKLESQLRQFGFKPLVLDKSDDFSLKASAQEEETVKVEESLTPVLHGKKHMKCPNSAELTPTKCSNIIEDSAESCIDSVEKKIPHADPKSMMTSPWPNLANERKSLMRNYGSGAGGADEEMFIKSFEDVPRISLYSAKELDTELTKIKETLGDPSNDWKKRVEMSRRLRSVIVAGGQDYDEFYPYLQLLEHPFQTSVKDLRSKVVREAAISIAYLSQQLGSKLDHFAEALLPCLINLIPNSAKIMSTAGIVAIRFIIRYTHVSRLIPIITSHLASKSKDIRKTCFEFLDQLLVTWPTQPMEKHVVVLTDAIRKGISDADPEARAFSRKAFWSFADHFREQADCLLNSLDNSKQRMLHDELTMSNSFSSSSLTQSGKPYRSTVSKNAGSVENLSLGRTGTLGRRTGIFNLPISKPDPSSGIPTRLRSTSAIDLSAVRRAKARASYSTIANIARGSGASLPQTPAARRNVINVHAITSPERVIKSRPRGSSQSQPTPTPVLKLGMPLKMMTPECISSPMPTTALPQRDLDPEDKMIESDIEYSGVCKELKFLDI